MSLRKKKPLSALPSSIKLNLIALLIAGNAYGAAALQPDQFTLSRLTDELRATNPQLKQTQNAYEAAKEVGTQQSAPDNPNIGFANNPWMKGGGQPMNANYVNQAYYYSITQNVYFPGKKGLMGDVADKQAEFSRTRVGATELQLINQLETNYFQAFAVEKMLDEVKNQIARLEQIKLATKIRYGNNAAEFSDFVSAQVAQSSAEKDQIALKRQHQVLKGNINTLIGRKPSAPLQLVYEKLYAGSPKSGLNDLVDRAMVRNPDVEGAAHLKDAATKSVDLAKLNYMPDFQVTAYANKQSQLWQGPGVLNYGAQVNVIVPWVVFDKERASVSQARANLRASQDNENSVRQQVTLAVENAHLVLQQSTDESNFIRARLMPEAQAAYRIALQSYTHASLSFADVINAQTNLKNTELQLVSAEVNILIARSNLEAAIGEKFE